ncbi:MAG: TraM recognition domain-containing protein [Candidatus Izemoplasmatales bacterium]
MFYCDEFGTLPPINSAEMMYSASRSRRLSIISIIQSHLQLEKNYGREGAAIIIDNCQLTIAGGFAPGSESAEIISKAMGSRTVMSGSVSRSKNDPSQSLQMIERPLMTPSELKAMKKGRFIVLKTGTNPFVSKLKLFFKWGIQFNEENPYTVADKGSRAVAYVSKSQIEDAIILKFPPPVSPKASNPPTDRHRMPPQPKGAAGNAEDGDDSGADMTPRHRKVGSSQKVKM